MPITFHDGKGYFVQCDYKLYKIPDDCKKQCSYNQHEYSKIYYFGIVDEKLFPRILTYHEKYLTSYLIQGLPDKKVGDIVKVSKKYVIISDVKIPLTRCIIDKDIYNAALYSALILNMSFVDRMYNRFYIKHDMISDSMLINIDEITYIVIILKFKIKSTSEKITNKRISTIMHVTKRLYETSKTFTVVDASVRKTIDCNIKKIFECIEA